MRMMIRRLIGLGWPPIVSPVTAAVTVTEARSMHATPVLLKAPGPKAKSKADPMVVKAREEKRQKRLRKALVKMERKDRLPRPLIENELPIEVGTLNTAEKSLPGRLLIQQHDYVVMAVNND